MIKLLVFACGLIAALIAMSEQLQTHFQAVDSHQQVIERGRKLPSMPGKGAKR